MASSNSVSPIPDQSADRAVWPDSPDDRAPRIRFVTELESHPDGCTLSITRTVTLDDVAVARLPVWSGRLAGPSMATACRHWLTSRPEQVATIAYLASIVTPERIDRILSVGAEAEHARQAEAARKSEEAAEKARIDHEKSLEIIAYFRGADSFRLELERGVDDGPFWKATFGEPWERQRFWDWLKWQRHRFEGFREELRSVAPVELERSLLKEMLAAEKAARREGLAAGGRRPLRFWRGQQ